MTWYELEKNCLSIYGGAVLACHKSRIRPSWIMRLIALMG